MNATLLCLIALAGAALSQQRPGEGARFFDSRVAPILAKRCLACHGDELKNADISFLDRDSLLKNGKRGPAIVPGKPEESILIQTLHHGGDVKMPPGNKLPPKDIKTLTEWIRRGAPWGRKLRGSRRILQCDPSSSSFHLS